MTAQLPPAGWYADPSARRCIRLRLWGARELPRTRASYSAVGATPGLWVAPGGVNALWWYHIRCGVRKNANDCAGCRVPLPRIHDANLFRCTRPAHA